MKLSWTILALTALFFFSGSARAEEPDTSHVPAPVEEPSAAPKTSPAKPPEARVLSTQEALVKGIKETGIQRFPLEKIASLLDDRPKTTPEDFSKLLDQATKDLRGAITEPQKQKLKKLYAEQLGGVKKGVPGTEFAAAARIFATTLSSQATLPPDGKSPGTASDPAGVAEKLSGQTIVQPPRADEQALSDLLNKSATAKLAELQKNFDAQLAQAQGLLNKAQGQNDPAGRAGRGNSLSDQLAALLKRKEGDKEGKESKGGGGEPPPSFGKKGDDHDTPTPPSDDNDKDSSKSPPSNKGDSNASAKQPQPQQAFNNQNSGNNNSNSDSSKNDGKNDKKGEAIIQAGELSKKYSEESSKAKEKDKEKGKNSLASLLEEAKNAGKTDSPDDGALAQAQALLAQGKPGQGEGKSRPGSPMKEGGKGGGGGGGGDGYNFGGPSGGFGGSDGGGGAGGTGKVLGGGGGGGNGGSRFDGDPFRFSEDNGGPSAPGSFNFQKPVEFGSSSNAGATVAEAETTVDGGPDEEMMKPKVKPNPLQPQVLVLGPRIDKKVSLMDYVGAMKKNLCDTAEAKEIGVCQRVLARRNAKGLHRKVTAAPLKTDRLLQEGTSASPLNEAL